MERRFYTVVTSKDNFIANIVNEDFLEFGKKNENDLNPSYIKKISGNLILENIIMLVPNGTNSVGIIVFKDLLFGSEFVTIPANSVMEIYFVKEELSERVRAKIAGIELYK